MAYNPGTQYRGDAYLFEGISRAGQAVGDGLQRARQRREQFDALAKYAVASGYAQKDDVVPLGLDELTGLVRAKEGQKIEQERAAVRADREAERLDRKRLTDAQILNLSEDNARAKAGAEYKAGQDRAAGNFWDAFALRDEEANQQGPPTPGGHTGRPISLGEIAGMAKASGYVLHPGDAVNLFDGMQKAAGKASPKPPELMTMENGSQIVYSAQTGRWEFVPAKPSSGSMKDRVAAARAMIAGAKEIPDPVKRNLAIDSAMAFLHDADAQGDGVPAAAGKADPKDPLGLFSK